MTNTSVKHPHPTMIAMTHAYVVAHGALMGPMNATPDLLITVLGPCMFDIPKESTLTPSPEM
jgi:hypothetical protein